MKTITILGSTGSVGTQVLDVISKYPNQYKVVGLSAYKNETLLREQVEKYNPTYYYFPSGAIEVQPSVFDFLEDKAYTKCLSSLEELASMPSDIVVSAVSGIAGLWSAVSVLTRGGTLAIANKETIVCAGRHLKALEKKYGGKILPLDTEHSAIFNCLRGEDKKQVKSLVLTASGGALRDLPQEKLSKIKADDALRHPVWKMGKKVTIDSATLFNKGLEVIEAMRLFETDADSVSVVMHRESIVHSLVEFKDNSMKGLLSVPDMRLAIDTALSYPAHGKEIIEPLSLKDVGRLTFSAPDYDRYPCLKLAIEAAKAGEGACIALSAADEVLVEEFLKDKIKFNDIAETLAKVLNKFRHVGDVKLEDILSIDEKARKYTYSVIGVK
ncbi:MAG: 1-deoxy-D-xylulose-5-phosphate reductoisomerase [Bacteroides sp.]|nr:1-deoxy-D-xylulose-5-phosphate reductoisomerase [Bacillota bacterium]MCM1394027.1 1-deoxy-D-xylulose-5-phosphate reductoisomerase [[Eubacterium] siraeum]MCM1455797.1 1-deoxy-D-xylulose-5-phosphate reductoisomerase [Bacteroides sp.]